MRPPLKIAVIGAGISGLSAAWLLSPRHRVTLFECDRRAGGHANTVMVPGRAGPVPVDTGFIVYNTQCYPNLIALFAALQVPTVRSDMSFAVSLDGGAYEYSGTGACGLFGQLGNIFNPRHLGLVLEIRRFFRQARDLLAHDAALGTDHRPDDKGPTLGQFLSAHAYSDHFIACHILPMAAAIWSAPPAAILQFPAVSFARFFANHGLLQIKNRPEWRTVCGGSRTYVARLLDGFRGEVALGRAVASVVRNLKSVTVVDAAGRSEDFDVCLLATHAPDALRLLGDADAQEQSLLGAFQYQRNRAVLHTDSRAMPARKRIWSSWNYIGSTVPGALPLQAAPAVTYWMNKLQPLDVAGDVFVSLNPAMALATDSILGEFDYAHPVFDQAAISAQQRLWTLQGRRRTWFCGSYFGYGFHEDGLQSGLAAAEDMGDVRRPWTVADESGRIHLRPHAMQLERREAAE